MYIKVNTVNGFGTITCLSSNLRPCCTKANFKNEANEVIAESPGETETGDIYEPQNYRFLIFSKTPGVEPYQKYYIHGIHRPLCYGSLWVRGQKGPRESGQARESVQQQVQ